jgi:hypothetical protein
LRKVFIFFDKLSDLRKSENNQLIKERLYQGLGDWARRYDEPNVPDIKTESLRTWLRPIYKNSAMLLASLANSLAPMDEEAYIGVEVYGMKQWTKILLPSEFLNCVRTDRVTPELKIEVLTPLMEARNRIKCTLFQIFSVQPYQRGQSAMFAFAPVFGMGVHALSHSQALFFNEEKLNAFLNKMRSREVEEAKLTFQVPITRAYFGMKETFGHYVRACDL